MTRAFAFVFIVVGLWLVAWTFWWLAGVVESDSSRDKELRASLAFVLFGGSVATCTLVWILWDVAGMVAE